MLPLRDLNPTRRIPAVTLALVAVIAVAFLAELAALADGGEAALGRLLAEHGVVPADLVAALRAGDLWSEPVGDVLTSMFLHADWLHAGGNLLYLWIFGNNVEDRLGRVRFLLFYLAGGVVAVAAQVWVDPGSRIPMIGGSGAIAAALGAYLVLFPRARVQSLVFLGVFVQVVAVPAVVVLGLWFVLQVVSGIGSLGATGGGVAFFAHIGGFVAGALLALPYRRG